MSEQDTSPQIPMHVAGEPLPIDWRPELIALDIDDTLVQHVGSLPGDRGRRN